MPLFTYEAWGISPAGFDTSHTFVRSHFVSPMILAYVRTVLCIYSFTTIIVCYSYLANHTVAVKLKDVNIDTYTLPQGKAAIGQSFSFFTYLTFWSLGIYFFISAFHTFMFAFRRRTWLHSWSKPPQLTHSLFYSTITTFPFLVTVVFWGILNSGWSTDPFVRWVNFSVHGLNSVFSVVEIVLPATQPQPWSHLSVVLWILSVYLGLAYLARETQGFYIYEWLNPARGSVSIVLHVLGYAAGMIALFVMSRYAIVGRDAFAKKMRVSRKTESENKASRLDDASDTWSSEVSVRQPARMHFPGGSAV